MSDVHGISGKNRLRYLIGLSFVISTFSSGAMACNFWDTTPCDSNDPHYLPDICQQYPDTPQCLGGWPDGGNGNAPSSDSLSGTLDTVNWTWGQVPRTAGNAIVASCSSSVEVRRASAAADVAAWWPTYVYPANFQLHFVDLTVRYSNGQRELWILAFPNPNNWGSEPILIGYNNRFGAGYLRLATPEDFAWYISDPSPTGPIYCK